MALRDQPYFPLYVQDYLTDEKLSCCTLSTQGVYIRILCVLHKSETYGGILFKQIPKQNLSSMQFFAYIISKQIGVENQIVIESIDELLFFKVLSIEQKDGVDFLFQKRMVRDFDISCKRSAVAKNGGGNPKLSSKKTNNLFKQKDKQNTEYENEYVNEIEIDNKNNNTIENREKLFYESVFAFSSEYSAEMLTEFFNYWSEKNQGGKKMRFEKQDTWELKKRLITWSNKSKTFNNGANRQTYATSTKDTAEERRAKIIAHATANTQQCDDDLQERGNIFEVVQSLEANAVSGQ